MKVTLDSITGLQTSDHKLFVYICVCAVLYILKYIHIKIYTYVYKNTKHFIAKQFLHLKIVLIHVTLTCEIHWSARCDLFFFSVRGESKRELKLAY